MFRMLSTFASRSGSKPSSVAPCPRWTVMGVLLVAVGLQQAHQSIVLLAPLVDDLHVAIEDLGAVGVSGDGGDGLAVLPCTSGFGGEAGSDGVPGEQFLVSGAESGGGDEV